MFDYKTKEIMYIYYITTLNRHVFTRVIYRPFKKQLINRCCNQTTDETVKSEDIH